MIAQRLCFTKSTEIYKCLQLQMRKADVESVAMLQRVRGWIGPKPMCSKRKGQHLCMRGIESECQHFFFHCAGLNSAHISPNTRLVLTCLLLIPCFSFRLFCCVFHGSTPSFLYPILEIYDICGLSIDWLLCGTPFTHRTTSPLCIWPFPKPWFTHRLWFKVRQS